MYRPNINKCIMYHVKLITHRYNKLKRLLYSPSKARVKINDVYNMLGERQGWSSLYIIDQFITYIYTCKLIYTQFCRSLKVHSSSNSLKSIDRVCQ